MSSKPDTTERRIDDDEHEDLVGVAGLGVLGATRDEDDREQTAERLERAQVSSPRVMQVQQPERPAMGGLSRRGALAALTGLGALGLGSGTASAVEEHDHLGDNWEGDSPTNYGLRIEPTSGAQFGIKGYSGSDNGRGVYGKASSESGEAHGVFGTTASSSSTAAGVQGYASSGKAKGVAGRTASTEGRGVLGRAQATTGETFGVLGWNDSAGDGAAGVSGKSEAGSGVTYGLLGRSDSYEGFGGLMVATADSGNTIGAEGRVESDNGTGAKGFAVSSDGTTTGVHGKVQSSEGTAVHAENTEGGQALQADGDADVTGDLSVGGVSTVGKLGAAAYLGSTTQTILASTSETVIVEFDNVVTDDRNEYDSATGVFQADNDGTYLVTTQITWDGNTISSNVPTEVEIHYDGSPVARNSIVTTSSNDHHSLEVSKTIRGVTAGKSITVEVDQEDDSDWDLLTGEANTWVEFTQIG